MDRTPEPLPSREHRLLVELVRRNAPALLPLATEAVNRRWLTDEEAASLSKVAWDEFLRHLGPDDSPDDDGVAADNLLGLLEMQRIAYWD